jgi:hypothetical protein
MFKKGEANAECCQHEQFNAKEEVEVTLRKLQTLKARISELRAQCEELKINSETRGNALLCSQCGEAIEPGQEIVVKGSGEAEKRQYHKECFKLLWV